MRVLEQRRSSVDPQIQRYTDIRHCPNRARPRRSSGVARPVRGDVSLKQTDGKIKHP